MELKPCPFCGSDNLTDKGYGILCNHCGCWMGDGTLAWEFAGGYKDAWNRRAEIKEVK
jgi:hypothetical protein